jgi:hypothetical protein
MQDLLPTLLDLCGMAKPAPAAFDGQSLAALLRGRAESLPDRMLVVQYSRARLEQWECAVIWNQWRLVHGKELYDVRADRGQTNDLAAQHPEIIAKMRAHYAQWWTGLRPKVDEFVPCATLGSDRQALVSLTSSDWQDVYCDNAGHIRNAVGGPRGGPWNVQVERAGEYELCLRRWPRETGLALGDSSGPGSKALPIAAGRVLVAGRAMAAAAKSTDQEIALRIRLPAGRTTLQAWFQDAQGQDLSGAFYVYVKKAN